MSADTKTLSAAVEVDSELAEQFEEYREQNGMTSKSEAVRHLLRAGLADEMNDDDRDARDEQPDQTSSDSPQIDIDLIRGNEPALFGLAFVIGSDGFLSVMQAVAGAFWGSILFGITGVSIIVAMFPMMLREVFRLTGRTGTGDVEANKNSTQS